MDHYATDATAVVEHLDLRNAIHIGHSTSGGEVARYVAKHGEPAGRVAKSVLVSALPPLMVKTEGNPGGLPIDVFDGLRKALADNRAQFFLDLPSGPFYGFNRPEAKVSQGVIQNWWCQGMMGGAKAPLRRHQSVFGNGPDRGLAGDQGACPATALDPFRRQPLDNQAQHAAKQAFVAYATIACLGVVEDASFYLLRVSTLRRMMLRPRRRNSHSVGCLFRDSPASTSILRPSAQTGITPAPPKAAGCRSVRAGRR